MVNFLIVARTEEAPFDKLIKRLIDVIEAKGGRATVATNPSSEGKRYRKLSVPEDVECIISVGGDGTMIRTAQNTASSGVPIVGLNLGHMGYLCDIDEKNLEQSIEKLFTGEFECEKRMMLEGGIEGEKERYKSLNDIVIASSAAGHSVINLLVNVNGSELLCYDCDGMVFATPTGSTAYNMSAGGPIANPKSNMIILTPLNAHTLNSRSVILDPDDEIKITLQPRRNDNSESAVVSFDGSHRIEIKAGQSVTLGRSKDTTQIITVAGTNFNFLERMRMRMQ